MKTPPVALEWLQEKCSQHSWATVVAERTVKREWVRQTGGRILRAGLSGTIKPSNELHLVIQDEGVPPEYVAAVRNAALSVLLSQSWRPVFKVRLTLFDFAIHGEESAYGPFYAVAQEVVSHLLGVAPESEHNIRW